MHDLHYYFVEILCGSGGVFSFTGPRLVSGPLMVNQSLGTLNLAKGCLS